ncbi:hypothetical protein CAUPRSCDRAFT_12339 [Caulochytrium protostelioides]|uniref:ATP-dependent RNA helicase DHX37-like C-terminal domain-containing protein n=1 Tax=Caulochytrium protostelioides TaxID=1555241 RepID=A0A4P9WRY9_9FUNG|nr:hypothetical protein CAUPRSCDRAFT_12339 [Caulochytrium protostelioides]
MWKRPTTEQIGGLVRRLIAAYPNQLARFKGYAEANPEGKNSGHRFPVYELLEGEPNIEHMYDAKQQNDPDASRPVVHITLHNRSLLRQGHNPPEWLAYHELIIPGRQRLDEPVPMPDDDGVTSGPRRLRMLRVFLKDVTMIRPEWIAPQICSDIIQWSAPMTEPLPAYDPASDAVMAYYKGSLRLKLPNDSETYGQAYGPEWDLPAQVRTMEPVAIAAAWFARALFDGRVLFPSAVTSHSTEADPFTFLTRFWLVKPPSLTSPNLTGRGLAVVQTLRQAHICSKHALLRMWQEKPAFLLEPMLQLLPAEIQSLLRKPGMWPPVAKVRFQSESKTWRYAPAPWSVA